MNTITNFRMNQPTINHRSNKIISNNQGLYTPAQNQPAQNNVQFKGLNLRALKALTPGGKKLEKAISRHNHDIAQILRVPSEKIDGITKGVSMERLNFLDTLTAKFHAKYGMDIGSEKAEKSDIIFDIYNSVKKPQKEHMSLIYKIHGKMSNIKDVFGLIGEDKQKLSLAKKIGDIINDGEQSNVVPNLMTDMLQSEHAGLYAKHFSEYEPYILANKQDSNVVKNLDRMVTTGTYNKNIVEREAGLKKLLSPYHLGETEVLNTASLKENYTQEGSKFLDAFVETYGGSADNMKAGNDKDVLAMYKSTTKENVDLRRHIMDAFAHNRYDNERSTGYNQNIADLRELFDRIDSDKHAANYVKKALAQRNMPRKASSLNTLFNRVSTKKLDIFYDNAQNIMGQVHGEEKFAALNAEITNPLFLTPQKKAHIMEMKEIGLKEGFTFGQKIKRVLKNQINKIRYSMSDDKQAKVAEQAQHQAEIDDIQRRMQAFLQDKPATPAPAATPAPTAEPVVAKIVETPVETKAAEIVETKPVQTVAEPQAQPVKKRAVRHFNVLKAPKAPSAKKLAVINDVNQIIEKKLGSKTLADQKRDYAIDATKMRMQMLPEIFESIKATRAAERAKGIKRPSVSNKDALALYSKINGRNKKLVNYMLKKRNADGTRTFSFNDVLSTIEQSETKLNRQKYSSPKTYKAADGKAYYANLLETQIQEHGKLQRTKKS